MPGRAEEGQARHAGVPRRAAATRMETMGRTVFSHGVMNWTKDDHWGFTNETGVMLKVVGRQVRRGEVTSDALRPPREAGGAGAPAAPRPDAGSDDSAWTSRSPASWRWTALTNGAVYALLALATVLVFAVTRVIFIPQGEFVAFGALTLALLQPGKVPGTVWLLLVLAALAALLDVVDGAARAALGAGAIALRVAARRWPVPVRRCRRRAAGPRRAACRSSLQALLTLALVTPVRPADLPPGLRVARRRLACWCC